MFEAVRVELLKARRSKMPPLTALAFSLAPFMGAFFMIVFKDPDVARRMGMISGKAAIFGGGADWHTYLGLLAQATAIGGVVLFGFVSSWVFGREWSDRTVKDLLALPTPRFVIVLAKYALVAVWCAALAALVYGVGLVLGGLIGLAGGTPQVLLQGTQTFIVVAVLTILLSPPIAFFASAGRGYLPPMGAVILFVILAQVIAATGWGEYFPWAVPALYSGAGGPELAAMGPISFVLVILTAIVGVVATLLWWERADQTH